MIAKIDIVLDAYEELRISGLTSSPNPSEIATAVKRLDMMVSGWKNKNICIAYNPSEPASSIDPNQDSGIDNDNMFALVANLAKILCARFGKACHPQTLADAKEGYDNLFSAVIPERESDPYIPKGSGRTFGNSFTYRFKYQDSEQNAPDNCDTFNIKVGEIGPYTESFVNYLNEVSGDTIAGYTVDDGQGVSILSHSELDGVITLNAEGLTAGLAPIKVTVTTSSGRVNPETINFNVTSE